MASWDASTLQFNKIYIQLSCGHLRSEMSSPLVNHGEIFMIVDRRLDSLISLLESLSGFLLGTFFFGTNRYGSI